MRYFYKLFIFCISFSKLIAGDESTEHSLFESLDSKSLIIYPSEMFVKTEQSVDEFSNRKLVDARDIPEMLEIYREREGNPYEGIQAVILDAIHGIDNEALAVIYEGFLSKCPNLRLVSLQENNGKLSTKEVSSTLCLLMHHSPQCVVDLSETEIRNKDVFPLLEKMKHLESKNYPSLEARIIFLRRNYLWDAENRVSCYNEKRIEGLLSPNWIQRHKDFHSSSTGLGVSTKKVAKIDLPYPINLVFGVYSSQIKSINFETKFVKLSLNTAEYSDNEDYNLTECSSADSSYLSHHMVSKYGDHLVNVRYIWLEDCGVDTDVLRHLREGFLYKCKDLRILSLSGNSIGAEVAEELINIWRTSPNCTFVLAHTTFVSLQNGRVLFKKIREFLPDEKDYELAVQRIILMDESTLKLSSHLDNGRRWEEEKLWPSDWKERHQEFWKIYASKRNRIHESLVSQDAGE